MLNAKVEIESREGVEIDSSKADILLNSKGEWNGSKLPKIVMETGEDINEDSFACGRRMMNWKEEKSKNLWIVERKGKGRSREESEEMEILETAENPRKKRKVEEEVEVQVEVPGKEATKDKDGVGIRNMKGQGTKEKKEGNTQNNTHGTTITQSYFVLSVPGWEPCSS